MALYGFCWSLKGGRVLPLSPNSITKDSEAIQYSVPRSEWFLWEIIASIDIAKGRQEWSLEFAWNLQISPEGCLQRGWNWDKAGFENGLGKQGYQGDSIQLGNLRQALSDEDDDLTDLTEPED